MDSIGSGRDLRSLIVLVVYFAPTLAGWIRTRSDPGLRIPLGLVFGLNLFLGWTVVGWIAARGVACRPSVVGPSGGESMRPGDGPFMTPIWRTPDAQIPDAQTPEAWAPRAWAPEAQMPCPRCQDRGEVCPRCQDRGEVCPRCQDRGEVCPRCFGNRGSWELPQGENGVSTWVPCSYCPGSGRVQCSQCGKTGYG